MTLIKMWTGGEWVKERSSAEFPQTEIRFKTRVGTFYKLMLLFSDKRLGQNESRTVE